MVIVQKNKDFPFGITPKLLGAIDQARACVQANLPLPDTEYFRRYPWRIGRLAEVRGEQQVALAVYSSMRDQTQFKYLKWRLSEQPLEILLNQVSYVEADRIARIFLHNQDITTAERFRLIGRERAREYGKFAEAAEQAHKMGRYDLAISDFRDFTKQVKSYSLSDNYEQIIKMSSIARTAKRRGSPHYKEMFDCLIEVCEANPLMRYFTARLFWESGEKEKALAGFKKTKCFKRTRDIEVNLYGKASPPSARRHVASLFEKGMNKLICVQDERLIREDNAQAYRWARIDGQEEYLLHLLNERFLLNAALAYSTEQGFDTGDLTKTLAQREIFKKQYNESLWANQNNPDKQQDPGFSRFMADIPSVFQDYFISEWFIEQTKSLSCFGDEDIRYLNLIGTRGIDVLERLANNHHGIYVAEHFSPISDYGDTFEEETRNLQYRFNSLVERTRKRARDRKSRLGVEIPSDLN